MADLGLYALPFGFGPASKAVSVAQAVQERAREPVRWTFVSSGIGLELLQRSGLRGTWCDTGQLDADAALADRFGRELDAMIVVMHRQWAHLLAPRLPVFCVDSLAHMWRPGAFEAFTGFQHVARYYVQDLFGAGEAMRSSGVPNVVPVRPLMAAGTGRGSRWPDRPLVHLGGLLTPFTDERVDGYVAGVMRLVRTLAPNAVVLTSQEATRRFGHLLEGVDHDSSSGPSEVVEAFAAAPVVYSSPGLTGLIEMCATRARMVPLPPANYSQVLTVRHFVRSWGAKLSPVWTFLDHAYSSVSSDLPEPEGVARVMSVNESIFASPRFLRDYTAVVDQVRASDLTLPVEFCPEALGAEDIARDLTTYLGI